MVTICSSKIELRLKCCATPWVGHLRRSHAIDPTARVRRFNLSRSLTHMVTVNHSRSRRLEYTFNDSASLQSWIAGVVNRLRQPQYGSLAGIVPGQQMARLNRSTLPSSVGWCKTGTS
eukprot:6112486-Pyramimonas_sp.AAC.1